MKRVKCKSGIEGWQDKLQNIYGTIEHFREFSNSFGVHRRLGYHSVQDVWEANPTIQGSINPDDLCVVTEKPKKSKKVKLVDALFAEYNKAYADTKPGEIFPQWFTTEQLKLIETVFNKK